jgi:hypothetical protein
MPLVARRCDTGSGGSFVISIRPEKAPGEDFAAPVEAGTHCFWVECWLHAGVMEPLLHRPEMPSLLLRQREQRDVFAREPLDFRSGHDDGRAAVHRVDDGDGLEVAVFDESGHYLRGGRELIWPVSRRVSQVVCRKGRCRTAGALCEGP